MRNLIVALLFCGGCAASNSSVAVEGNDIDLTLLAGKWSGTYEGTKSGRKGTVSLDLSAGNRVAEGKIVMAADSDPAHSRELSVKFMQVGGRKLTGTLTPYTDPQCNCQVETEFIGVMTGDNFSGTFSSAPVGAAKQPAGTWTAQRQR